MVIYSVVDDAYDVYVFRSLQFLVAWLASERLYAGPLAQEGDATLPAPAFKQLVEKQNIVRLYEAGQRDWRYKVRLHRIPA
jgi:hypothetical protein